MEATGIYTCIAGIFKLLSVIVVGFVIYKMKNRIIGNKNQDINSEIQLAKMTGLSGFGGFLSSVMAIGAGMIYVPAMKFFGNLGPRKAIGSSLNIMMVVVPFAMFAHFLLLEKYQSNALLEDWFLLTVLIVINFIGAKIGAMVGFKLFDERILLKLFVGVLSITWINYVIDLIT